MADQLTLSRYKLTTFLACRRQFQLRYLDRLSWPHRPLNAQSETAVTRGHAFHQLIQQHFLGIPVVPSTIEDVQLRRWWTLFVHNKPPLPDGQRLPEISLTVPVGNYLLNGRFDLVVLSETAAGRPAAHVFDWKTGSPQDESKLRHDWQTRLYLGMLAMGGRSLWPGKYDDNSLEPENVSITYWYVQEPDAPRVIRYHSEAHAQNWAELGDLMQQIEQQLAGASWPLTDDLSQCRTCAFQTFCGRQEAGTETAVLDEDIFPTGDVNQLEPDLP